MKFIVVTLIIFLSSLNNSAFSASQMSPSDLFYAGYRGQLKEQGIEAYNSFCWEWKTHRMSAVTLIEAGIAAYALPEILLQDEGYVSGVTNAIIGTCRYN